MIDRQYQVLFKWIRLQVVNLHAMLAKDISTEMSAVSRMLTVTRQESCATPYNLPTASGRLEIREHVRTEPFKHETSSQLACVFACD